MSLLKIAAEKLPPSQTSSLDMLTRSNSLQAFPNSIIKKRSCLTSCVCFLFARRGRFERFLLASPTPFSGVACLFQTLNLLMSHKLLCVCVCKKWFSDVYKTGHTDSVENRKSILWPPLLKIARITESDLVFSRFIFGGRVTFQVLRFDRGRITV